MNTETEDKLDGARSQAIAQYESIVEMVERLQVARDGDEDDNGDDAERAIHEDALSVQVRSGWYSPGGDGDSGKPEEFEILLCTGGPAVRIMGELSEHGEPRRAWIECQDWFTPWTFVTLPEGSQDVLLAYAQCFYFGEG